MLHVVIGKITCTVSLLAIRNCVMWTGCMWLIAFWGCMNCRSTYNLLEWSSPLPFPHTGSEPSKAGEAQGTGYHWLDQHGRSPLQRWQECGRWEQLAAEIHSSPNFMQLHFMHCWFEWLCLADRCCCHCLFCNTAMNRGETPVNKQCS